jgi:hypothetical protein
MFSVRRRRSGMETPSASYECCEYLFAQFYEGLLGL